MKKSFAVMLALTAALAAAHPETVRATESEEVVITQEDKPYLALGADLSAEEQHTVLKLMGIEAGNFDSYDVVYVNNSEEHEYLDAYVPKEKIGTRALSSVFICLEEEGKGVHISTYNINYCTSGMYRNALATAGITDASIIVAGPFEISGTAALVGTFKAYEELTGETLDEGVVDAAMDELVTTGELEQSIDGPPEAVESMITELKGRIARGELETPEQIKDAIGEVAENYGISLSSEDKEKLTALLEKLKGLDLDWESIADQAANIADKIGGALEERGFFDAIRSFFEKIIEAIRSWFS